MKTTRIQHMGLAPAGSTSLNSPLMHSQLSTCCSEGQQKIEKPVGALAVTVNNRYHQGQGGRKSQGPQRARITLQP